MNRRTAAFYALWTLGAAVPLAGLGWTSARLASARLGAALGEARRDRARLAAELVEAQLGARLAAAAADAADPDLVSAAARRDAAAARRRLAVMQGRGLDRVFLVDAAGTLWADAPAAPESLGRSFAHRSWFQDVAASSAAAISEAYVRHAAPQLPVVAVAAPVFRDGRRLGVLVHQYGVADLGESLGLKGFGRSGRTFVVDHAGRPLAEPSDEAARALPGSPAVRGALSGRSGLSTFEDPVSRGPVDAAFAPVRAGTRTWGVVAAAPAGETAEVLAALRLQLAAATAAAMILVGAAALQLGRARERERRLASELEERGRELEGQARELARSNAELEQFAYLASHDLQAPLRSIKNYVDLLEERAGATLHDEGRRLVGLARESVGRMQRMVTDLLEFSRLGRDKEPAMPVTLESCLDEALGNLASETARRRAVIERGALPSVQGRPAQLARLFQNLVGNALKYCEGEPRVRVSAERGEGVWTVSVADNGIGVAPDKLESVFGLFERLHPWERYEGSGIGLAACRKIVEHHGGRIWLESTPGRGTTVKFTLPANG